MNKLSSSKRSYLRKQAHHLEPSVLIGKNGILDGTIELVDKALTARELIKIKFHEYKDEKQFLSNQIAASTNAHIVGLIGNIAILFRQNHESEIQLIKFPTKH